MSYEIKVKWGNRLLWAYALVGLVLTVLLSIGYGWEFLLGMGFMIAFLVAFVMLAGYVLPEEDWDDDKTNWDWDD